MDFLRHWDLYGAQVCAIIAESRPIWCFHNVASCVFFFLNDGRKGAGCCWVYLISAHLVGIVVVVPCFGCWGYNVFMFADRSSSRSQCSPFPGSTRLSWVVVKSRINCGSAGDSSLLSIGVALICSRASWTSFLSLKLFFFFYRGLDVSHISFDKTVTSDIVGWAGGVLDAQGLNKAWEGLSWVLWAVVYHYFVWASE